MLRQSPNTYKLTHFWLPAWKQIRARIHKARSMPDLLRILTEINKKSINLKWERHQYSTKYGQRNQNLLLNNSNVYIFPHSFIHSCVRLFFLSFFHHHLYRHRHCHHHPWAWTISSASFISGIHFKPKYTNLSNTKRDIYFAMLWINFFLLLFFS